jgi:hypothetical protein
MEYKIPGAEKVWGFPFPPDDPATVQMVNELNAWEFSGADLPPHFGVKCFGNRGLA